jgi:hypothetical protein
MHKNAAIIKVGICVSYDWMLLKKSVPLIYTQADTICLSIDKLRRSWRGTRYEFDEGGFADWIASIDVDKKIDLYEDDFFIQGLSPMENDNRQRNLMGARMGNDGWFIQIDSDEYFLDFAGFKSYLLRENPDPREIDKPVNYCAFLIPLIKRNDDGYIYVDFKNRVPEFVPVATNRPVYLNARRNGHFNKLTPFFAVHETWARSEDELKFKMNNWGHSDQEFGQQSVKDSYYNLWSTLDEHNYKYITDFHPAKNSLWPRLAFCKASTIEELMRKIAIPKQPYSKIGLMFRNSRNIARLKALLKR